MKFTPVIALFILVPVISCTTNTTKQQESINLDLVDLRTWDELGDVKWSVGTHTAAPEIYAAEDAFSGFLVSPRPYKNFSLSVEFWIDDDTNSGIFVRCQDISVISPMTCYEANIWDNHPNQSFRTGSIVNLQSPSAKVDTLGRWNRYDITADGRQLTLSINGQQTAQLNDATLASGHIALQYAGKRSVKFRNLSLREL